MNAFSCLVALVVAFFLVRPCSAQCELEQLYPLDAVSSAAFGTALTVDSGTLAVGVPNDDQTSFNSGAVEIYELTDAQWHKTAKLKASNVLQGAGFGSTLSLSGDRLLVGAPGVSAYIFDRTGGSWVESAVLPPPSGAAPLFGRALSLSGDTAAIGSFFILAPGVGSVFLYEKAGGVWGQVAELSSSDGANGDGFGSAVAVSGTTLVAGAPDHSAGDLKTGAAYVFERTPSGWVETDKLTASDGTLGDQFGGQVTLYGDSALIGAARDQAVGIGAGAAYLFERTATGWNELTKLVASNPTGGILDPFASFDEFGSAVALGPGSAFVGSPGHDGAAKDAGPVYLFTASGQPGALLAAMPASLSLSAGGVQDFAFETCAQFAGKTYLVLGSASGDSPGLLVDGLILPLNGPDPWLPFTLANPNSSVLVGTLGALGTTGQASASLVVPPAASATLAGLVLHHAVLVLDVPGSAQALVTSHSAAVTLVP